MRTVAGCAEKLGEDELRELRARQAALEQLYLDGSPVALE
jgi:hypothetical protein